MGRFYIKPDRDTDYYAEWSTIVDSVVGYGTRAEMLDDAREEFGRRGVADAERALLIADQHGTSARRGRGDGRWDDSRLRIMEGGGPGYLARADLRRYCDLLRAGGDEAERAAYALVVPDQDDEVELWGTLPPLPH